MHVNELTIDAFGRAACEILMGLERSEDIANLMLHDHLLWLIEAHMRDAENKDHDGLKVIGHLRQVAESNPCREEADALRENVLKLSGVPFVLERGNRHEAI